MSKYERERGDYIIPSSEWAGLKRKIRERYNRMQQDRYELAERIHERIDQKGEDFSEAFKGETESYSRSVFGGRSKYPRYDGPSLPDPDRSKIKQELYRKDHGRLLTPRKKAFPKKTNRDTSFKLDMIGRPVVSLSNESRRVRWHVSENNRAVEDAREHPVAKAFFAALADISERDAWTRRSGGSIKYSNDYLEEQMQGPTVKSRYGPYGQPTSSQPAGIRRR
jgi:hypothetical protein